jgi:Pyruvate/2-oxoacid:ferredoxin oxidoreductase delta subunit
MEPMGRPLWVTKVTKKAYKKLFTWAKMTKWPIMGPIMKKWLFKNDYTIFLPKDSVIQIEIDETFQKPEDMVLPSQVLATFIEKASHHFIMNFCLCRESLQCKNYPRDLGCLFLGDAVLDINPELGRIVTKEEAMEHLVKCRDKGLIHMIGRNKVDSVWLNVDGRKLMTICSCCPCCCIFRMEPYLHKDLQRNLTRMPGVTISVNDKCIGCGTCIKTGCFMNALELIDGKIHIKDNCKICGRCASVCPQKAIDIVVHDIKSVQESVEIMSSRITI